MTIYKKERPKLNYRFYDPNPPGAMAEYLLKLLVEVNMPKAEAAIQAVADAQAARAMSETVCAKSLPNTFTLPAQKESVIAQLHAPAPELPVPKASQARSKTGEPEL